MSLGLAATCRSVPGSAQPLTRASSQSSRDRDNAVIEWMTRERVNVDFTRPGDLLTRPPLKPTLTASPQGQTHTSLDLTLVWDKPSLTLCFSHTESHSLPPTSLALHRLSPRPVTTCNIRTDSLSANIHLSLKVASPGKSPTLLAPPTCSPLSVYSW
uniref:Uncharacterized protein n=1 Tax=Molossus molossus TaxID=27622 RepID=A0A7J8DQ97_MOLMO|nr:hypothetical protein HJG59_009268 [Molossus molossus]